MKIVVLACMAVGVLLLAATQHPSVAGVLHHTLGLGPPSLHGPQDPSSADHEGPGFAFASAARHADSTPSNEIRPDPMPYHSDLKVVEPDTSSSSSSSSTGGASPPRTLPETNGDALLAWLPPWVETRAPKLSPAALVDQPGKHASSTEPKWHSQYGEDEYAWENFLHNLQGGTYLELGALEGVIFSNTLFLHQHQGWRGVLIEPNPEWYLRLIGNRKGDICVNAAVCDSATTVHFAMHSDTPSVSGIWEFMSEGFRHMWHANVTDPWSLPSVMCLPLTSILGRFGISHIDFLSLDVEGAELKVLQTLDFSQISVSVMVVEADGNDVEKEEAIRKLLEANGFHFHGHVVQNDWFVHRNFKPSSKRDAKMFEPQPSSMHEFEAAAMHGSGKHVDSRRYAAQHRKMA